MDLRPPASEVPLPSFCQARSASPHTQRFGAEPRGAARESFGINPLRQGIRPEPSRWAAAEELVRTMFAPEVRTNDDEIRLQDRSWPTACWPALPPTPMFASAAASRTNDDTASRVTQNMRRDPNVDDRAPSSASVAIMRVPPLFLPVDVSENSRILPPPAHSRFRREEQRDRFRREARQEARGTRSSEALPSTPAARQHESFIFPGHSLSPRVRTRRLALGSLDARPQMSPTARDANDRSRVSLSAHMSHRRAHSDDAARRDGATGPRQSTERNISRLQPSLDTATAIVVFQARQHNSTDYSAERCAVCLEDFVKGNMLRILPCMHRFHSACVDPWLEQHCLECPLCRNRAT